MNFLNAILFIAFAAVLLIAVPILGGSFGKKKKHKKINSSQNAVSLNKADVAARWQEIQSVAKLGGAAQLKSAVMDADKLLEKVLFSKGYSGKTFAECLKSAKSKFPNYSDYDNVWFAHKIRNSIAHDNGYDFSASSAQKSLGYYEKAFKILGAL
jgi:hypothetical protein